MQKCKYSVLVVFLVFFSFAVQAQEEKQSIVEEKAYRRELGFGTNIILSNVFSSEGAPLDFLFRWGRGKGFFRLGTSFAYHSNDEFTSDLRVKIHSEQLSAEVLLGKEFRSGLGGRWQVNYGADFTFSYRSIFREETNRQASYDGSIQRVLIGDSNSIGAGLKPFIGLLFQINQRLLIGTEASFKAEAVQDRTLAESYLVIDNQRDEIENFNEEETGWNFNVRTLPASNIFVYYRF